MYLYGAGAHSKVIVEILESNGFKVIGIFDDYTVKLSHNGIKVFPGIKKSLAAGFPTLDESVIITIGNNMERAEISQMLKVRYETAIHKSAIVSSTVNIGEGTVILHGAIVQVDSKIGKHVLVNTGGIIDHDNIIGDFVHISPKVVLCGHVEVGEGTHIGAGVVVIPEIKIGKWCVIGAGSIVIRDIPDFSVAVGNPAKILVDNSLRQKQKYEAYFTNSL